MTKTCFVIMGFQTKKIPNTNIEVNLDDTYNYLIKPVLINCGLVSVYPYDSYKYAFRCDEYLTSQAINETFMRNLYIADIVIADITALNQNAIYELGMRHAMKPKSTIIMCDNKTLKSNSFFDLTFIPHIIYDSDNQRDHSEIERIASLLSKTIETCKNSGDNYIDSPVFSYGIYQDNGVVGCSKNKIPLREKIQYGNELIENEYYSEAEKVFEEVLTDYVDNDIICSYVLAKYKKDISIENLDIALKKLVTYFDLENTICEDALGIAAAINLKLFYLNKESYHLYQAIEYYRKGANYESGNLYCGKNYCSALLKIYLVQDNIEILKEYYYTAVHQAKILLEHSYTLKRKSDTFNNVWFFSNINDLHAIATGEQTAPYVLNYPTARQQSTVEQGRTDLLKDIQNMKSKIYKE